MFTIVKRAERAIVDLQKRHLLPKRFSPKSLLLAAIIFVVMVGGVGAFVATQIGGLDLRQQAAMTVPGGGGSPTGDRCPYTCRSSCDSATQTTISTYSCAKTTDKCCKPKEGPVSPKCQVPNGPEIFAGQQIDGPCGGTSAKSCGNNQRLIYRCNQNGLDPVCVNDSTCGALQPLPECTTANQKIYTGNCGGAGGCSDGWEEVQTCSTDRKSKSKSCEQTDKCKNTAQKNCFDVGNKCLGKAVPATTACNNTTLFDDVKKCQDKACATKYGSAAKCAEAKKGCKNWDAKENICKDSGTPGRGGPLTTCTTLKCAPTQQCKVLANGEAACLSSCGGKGFSATTPPENSHSCLTSAGVVWSVCNENYVGVLVGVNFKCLRACPTTGAAVSAGANTTACGSAVAGGYQQRYTCLPGFVKRNPLDKDCVPESETASAAQLANPTAADRCKISLGAQVEAGKIKEGSEVAYNAAKQACNSQNNSGWSDVQCECLSYNSCQAALEQKEGPGVVSARQEKCANDGGSWRASDCSCQPVKRLTNGQVCDMRAGCVCTVNNAHVANTVRCGTASTATSTGVVERGIEALASQAGTKLGLVTARAAGSTCTQAEVGKSICCKDLTASQRAAVGCDPQNQVQGSICVQQADGSRRWSSYLTNNAACGFGASSAQADSAAAGGAVAPGTRLTATGVTSSTTPGGSGVGTIGLRKLDSCDQRCDNPLGCGCPESCQSVTVSKDNICGGCFSIVDKCAKSTYLNCTFQEQCENDPTGSQGQGCEKFKPYDTQQACQDEANGCYVTSDKCTTKNVANCEKTGRYLDEAACKKEANKSPIRKGLDRLTDAVGGLIKRLGF